MKNTGLKLSKYILFAILIFPLFFTLPTQSQTSISQNTKEYQFSAGDFYIDEVTYTNHTDKDQKVNITASAYDPKEEKFLETTPFVSPSVKNLTVKKKSSITIKYVITIPSQQPNGSYFNVITIEPQESTNNSGNVAIKNGYGVLIAIHISDSTNSFTKTFIDKSDSQLVVTSLGFPFLSPMKLEYVYTNNTSFVFRPEGEIRIVTKDGLQTTERFEINSEKKAVYPGETITLSKEAYTWNDVSKVFDTKIVSSRTYNGVDTNYILNEVELNILPQVIAATGLTVIVLIGIGIIIRTILRVTRKSGK